jgi:hypothetical protein
LAKIFTGFAHSLSESGRYLPSACFACAEYHSTNRRKELEKNIASTPSFQKLFVDLKAFGVQRLRICKFNTYSVIGTVKRVDCQQFNTVERVPSQQAAPPPAMPCF